MPSLNPVRTKCVAHRAGAAVMPTSEAANITSATDAKPKRASAERKNHQMTNVSTTRYASDAKAYAAHRPGRRGAGGGRGIFRSGEAAADDAAEFGIGSLGEVRRADEVGEDEISVIAEERVAVEDERRHGADDRRLQAHIMK
ncbi:MAG: hypothetical protein QM775_03135 [Pirellulales bacterium]